MGYRVSRQDLARGEKIERKEHPSLSDRMVRRIARDHLEERGPAAYRDEKMTEKLDQQINKKMGAKPKRRHVEREYNPMTDGIPRAGRFWNI